MICHPERSEGPAFLCAPTTFTSWPANRGFSTSVSRTTSGDASGNTRTTPLAASQASTAFTALYTLRASSTSETRSREKNISRVGCAKRKLRPRSASHRRRQSLLFRHGSRESESTHRPDAGAKPRRLANHGHPVPHALRLPQADHRRGERSRGRRWNGSGNSVRLHVGGAGSEVRIHRSPHRIRSRDRLDVPLAAR